MSAPTARSALRVHEPRRDDCPWCGSRRLRTRLRAPDLLQHKPGTFVVDECLDCAHVFQNPRLTPQGLAPYLRDLDAGPHSPRSHRSAARAMLPFPEPESWLDVGAGDAHFAEAAKEFFPYTSFDGIDPTPRVERARAAGRVEEAYVGRLTDPQLTARLRARYDVVSLFHHLPRVPDPREELGAALTVLRPGGHLLLELPDPRCAFATLLGKWWLPHGQPRQLQLMPPANLRTELEAHGCTIVSVDHRAPHIPNDLAAAASLALNHKLPTPLRRAATPVTATAAALDHSLAPALRRTRFSNAYRIIARRERSAP
jgi:SAM-dependent methyltransferase